MWKKRFWTSLPSHSNAVELFAGEWASDLAEVLPGLPHAGAPMFYQDRRPRQAAAALGVGDRLDGMSVLELGPLEGAHSYQLEKLGAAQVTAIEANADAFKRCLAVKNMLGLDRTTFLLGDFSKYLATTPSQFDLVFASGVLYHMDDPVELVRLVAARTRRVFIWSQYYDAAFRTPSGKPLPHRPTRYRKNGLDLPMFEHSYGNRLRRDFFGGIRSRSRWLALDGIVAVLRHHGFPTVDIIEDDRNGERGPNVTLAARR